MSIRVGLVGAGHWAATFHAPMIRDSPHTTLTAVWARRPRRRPSWPPSTARRRWTPWRSCSSSSTRSRSPCRPTSRPRSPAGGARRQAPGAGEAARARPGLGRGHRRRGGGGRGQHRGRAAQPLHQRRAHVRPGRAGCRGAGGPGLLRHLRGAGGVAVRDPVARRARCGPRRRSARAGPPRRRPRARAGRARGGDPTHWVSLTTHHEGGAVGQAALSITTPNAANLLRVEVWTETGPVVFDGAAPTPRRGSGSRSSRRWRWRSSTGATASSACAAGSTSSACSTRPRRSWAEPAARSSGHDPGSTRPNRPAPALPVASSCPMTSQTSGHDVVRPAQPSTPSPPRPPPRCADGARWSRSCPAPRAPRGRAPGSGPGAGEHERRDGDRR